MKLIKKIIIFALTAVLALSVLACGNADNGGETEPKKWENSGYNVVENGRSDYTIVIPENADYDESMAADELQYFLEESTGVTLPIVKENKVGKTGKILSVGKTAMLEKAGITLDSKALGTSGHKLVTKGDNLFMSGAKGEGSVYAVYSFLENTLGLNIYAYDDFYIEKTDTVELFKFDETINPAISRRSAFFMYWEDYDEYYKVLNARRLKLCLPHDNYIAFGHNMINEILPHAKYAAKHPEWYSKPIITSGEVIDIGQLCLTNDELRAEFVRRGIELVNKYPDKDYFMIGMEDNNDYCTCDGCKAALAANDGICSAVFINFVNKVAEEIDAYLAENDPDRNLYYFMYAYNYNVNAPVKEVNGEYVPINDGAVTRDNVVVVYAPLVESYSYSYADAEHNEVMNTAIRQWTAVTKNFYFYSYSYNIWEMYAPFNNLATMQQNYAYAAENNFFYTYEESFRQVSLARLKMYLMGKLMWNPYQNTDELAYDFIEHYYGPVAGSFKQYYAEHRQWLNYMRDELGYKSLVIADTFSSKYYPKALLDGWYSDFEAMVAELEPLKTTDPEAYEKYLVRIKAEEISIEYMLLELHFMSFSRDRLVKMIDDVEKYASEIRANMQYNGNPIGNVINGWRNKL